MGRLLSRVIEEEGIKEGQEYDGEGRLNNAGFTLRSTVMASFLNTMLCSQKAKEYWRCIKHNLVPIL